MRINIWIVLAVLLALLATTRLLQDQHETQRICADDPSASVCGRQALPFTLGASIRALPDLCFGIVLGGRLGHLALGVSLKSPVWKPRHVWGFLFIATIGCLARANKA